MVELWLLWSFLQRIDPLSLSPQKALEQIGQNLQKQYERWQPRGMVVSVTLNSFKLLLTSDVFETPSPLQAVSWPHGGRSKKALRLAPEECQRGAGAIPLQRARGPCPDHQWGDLGFQPELHTVHPTVYLWSPNVDELSEHLCVWL